MPPEHLRGDERAEGADAGARRPRDLQRGRHRARGLPALRRLGVPHLRRPRRVGHPQQLPGQPRRHGRALLLLGASARARSSSRAFPLQVHRRAPQASLSLASSRAHRLQVQVSLIRRRPRSRAQDAGGPPAARALQPRDRVAFLCCSLAVALSLESLGTMLAVVGATGSTLVRSYILPGGIYCRAASSSAPRRRREAYVAAGMCLLGCFIMPTGSSSSSTRRGGAHEACEGRSAGAPHAAETRRETTAREDRAGLVPGRTAVRTARPRGGRRRVVPKYAIKTSVALAARAEFQSLGPPHVTVTVDVPRRPMPTNANRTAVIEDVTTDIGQPGEARVSSSPSPSLDFVCAVAVSWASADGRTGARVVRASIDGPGRTRARRRSPRARQDESDEPRHLGQTSRAGTREISTTSRAPRVSGRERARAPSVPAAAPPTSPPGKTPSTQASTARAKPRAVPSPPREKKAAEAVVLPMAPPVIHPEARAPPVVLSEQELDDHLREFGREQLVTA